MRTTKILTIGVCTVLVISLCAFTVQDVKGWFVAGSKPESYKIGVEKDAYLKQNVGYIASSKDKIDGFGVMMQTFIPEDYLGTTVKLTAFIKTKDVKNWAGMWMRVDGKSRKVLGFDNMQNRPIKGTTQWKKHHIVLKVPKESKFISYGAILNGTGKVWFDNVKFTVVRVDDPKARKKGYPRKPQNTSFEEFN
ncbi:MAG: hypothetical protein AAGL34_19020 [Bacteroidota bacterium]